VPIYSSSECLYDIIFVVVDMLFVVNFRIIGPAVLLAHLEHGWVSMTVITNITLAQNVLLVYSQFHSPTQNQIFRQNQRLYPI